MGMWECVEWYDRDIPGEDGQQPVLPVVAEHLAEVGETTQVIAILVGAANAKDGSPKRLWMGGQITKI